MQRSIGLAQRELCCANAISELLPFSPVLLHERIRLALQRLETQLAMKICDINVHGIGRTLNHHHSKLELNVLVQ